ncbi:hypothetical protein HDG35_007163 [Paraburkholderia sp. JPY681]|nr:hypothetical protein [Paraburkholderia atlantica]
MHQAFHFGGNFVALLAQGRELLGQTRYDDCCGLNAGHDHSLFAQRLNGLDRKAFCPCAVRVW